MGPLIFEIVSFYGAITSAAALAIEFRPTGNSITPFEIALVTLCVVLALLWTRSRIKQYRITAPVVCNNDLEIRRFMHDWIGQDGSVVIFTRDMSWAHNAETEGLLFQKATKNELTLVLEHEIPLAGKLRAAGAKIIIYSDLHYTPAARFTIIKHGRHDAQVAVGGTVDGRHVINKFQQGHDVFFSVANDLVNVLTAYQAKR